MKVIENMTKIYNKIKKPKILFPNFEKTVGCISFLPTKSMYPLLLEYKPFSMTPIGLIIAEVPLFADLITYFPLSIDLKTL
jgi:hypothetical protein